MAGLVSLRPRRYSSALGSYRQESDLSFLFSFDQKVGVRLGMNILDALLAHGYQGIP